MPGRNKEDKVRSAMISERSAIHVEGAQGGNAMGRLKNVHINIIHNLRVIFQQKKRERVGTRRMESSSRLRDLETLGSTI